MIEMFGSADCVGCGACANACPVGCITMQPDAEGFLFPVVDAKACVQCGRCEAVCPANQKMLPRLPVEQTYAAVSKRDAQRMDSSSGGVFSLLAETILDQGGVVFGAAFSEDFKSVRHIAVRSRDALQKLRSSKYLQSSIGDAYVQTKKYLAQGIPVLFTGTPCQIGGLRTFLGKDCPLLYTQSIVCHGVSSPLVWRKYASFRENEAGAALRGVSFRKKEPGWKNYSMEMTFENHDKFVCPASKDLYMRCFLKELSLRHSCYRCQFKAEQDSADLTLGDFWGIQYVLPEMDDNKGTSLVMVRTEKGRQLLQACGDWMEIVPVDYAAAVQGNPAAVRSVKKPFNRSRFMRQLQCQSVEQVLRRYGKDAPFQKTASKLRWYKTKIQRILLKLKKS